jgi:1,4-alpha-glucan branching enzyme
MAKRKSSFPGGPTNPKTALARAAVRDSSPPSIQPVAERFPALEEQEVIFTTLAPEAREVNVAGNFNDWRPETTPMKNTGEGKWVGRSMLRAGQYEYRFVVDGQWREDAQATQRVANPHGGFNSVLMVPLAVRTSIL